MKCSQCQFDNPIDARFCNTCGHKLGIVCQACNAVNPPSSKYCNQCSLVLKESDRVVDSDEPITSPHFSPSQRSHSVLMGERKHVTVLFADLTGYTAISERFDIEEIKNLMDQIFSGISDIVNKYEGFIEKFIGDAVMAIFGVPKAHEDDPVRSIRVAREINSSLESINKNIEPMIGMPISMHIGIHTGLVVTGEVNKENGTHGTAGDTINLASRLCDLGRPGEILVSHSTYRQAVGYFSFERLEPREIKGKAKRVNVYKVLLPRVLPSKNRRSFGFKAELVGRKTELGQLIEAVEKLKTGRGSVISIWGNAGTGKSRLVEDFKDILNPGEFQWLEGHAYAYSQNIPYFPLIDLFSRAFQINEQDPSQIVRDKIEVGITKLVGSTKEIAPYIGSLYSLNYPEISNESPEFWLPQFHKALKTVFLSFAQIAPTIIYFEDLHWADPSSIENIHFLISEFQYKVFFLCVSRPAFALFTSQQLNAIKPSYTEIQLQDLSRSEAQFMLESLLNTEKIPLELRSFIRDKIEGNPFYLEEVVNSLIESKLLIRDNVNWSITRPISSSDISPTIHGVLSARLDRLEDEDKRLLQHASVIGRSFYYKVLKKITNFTDNLDKSLYRLEQLDLIRTKTIEPDLEFIFKHALTQEVVYNGLLRRELADIHQRIGRVMEQMFRNRLPEFYEALSFHYVSGGSPVKAVNYLTLSGEKSLKRYAVEEANQFYKQAFDIITNEPDSALFDKGLLIDILIQWAFVFHYRGDFKALAKLLIKYEKDARNLGDPARLGMFNTLLGVSLYQLGRVNDAYRYQLKALQIGEDIQDNKVIGYSCSWLTWTYAELGQIDKAIESGERAFNLHHILKSEDFLFFNSLGGIGVAYYYSGNRNKVEEISHKLLEFGQNRPNTRSLVLGYFTRGCSNIMAGDFQTAIGSFKNAIEVSSDPFYAQFPSLLLGLSYILGNQFKAAESILENVLHHYRQFGTGIIGIPARSLVGFTMIANGQLSKGLQMVEEAQKEFLVNKRKFAYATAENIIGKLYIEVAKGTTLNLSLAKNIKFLIKNVPFASKRAEKHLNRCILMAKDFGADLLLGHSYLDLGTLNMNNNRYVQARNYITKAVPIFESCGADAYLQQAHEMLQEIAE